MATALQEDTNFSQILQCPICLESFKRPKVLPCGHTYCASCLQSHINKKNTHSKTTQACFPCPVCNEDAIIADSSICIEQWAESFPVNSIVSALIDASAKKKEGYNCDQCIKHGEESLSKYFCKDCGRTMCMSCKKKHDGFPSLSTHDVINVCENAECFLIYDMSTIDKCHRHNRKRIEFICEDHDTLCCSSCAILEHRKCERVQTLECMLKSINVTKKSQQMKFNSFEIEEHLNKIARNVKSCSDNIHKDKTDILEQMYSIKTQVMTKLEEFGNIAIESLETKYISENSNLQNQEIKGRRLITAVANDHTQLNLVMTHGSEIQKLIMLLTIDANQARYFKAMSEFEKEIKDVNLRFDVDETFPTFLNTVTEFGKISVNVKHTDVSSASFKAVNSNVQPISKSIPFAGYLNERIAVKVTEFNVKISGDRNKCRVSHILLFSDTRKLLVDHGNSKVKLFGPDNRCKEFIKFEERPWSACSLYDTEIAITLPFQRTIHIIDTKDTMRKKRNFRTRFQCWGIAMVNDQLVITTRVHIVLILDMNGKEIRSVQTENNHGGKPVEPNFIKVDMTNSAMYISYETAHKLVAYSMNWDVLFTYTNQNLTSPTGIDIDREGNIYLCGYNSHCVQQISAEGKHIKTLISKEPQNMRPLCIMFERHVDMFFLTYGRCDILEVYELRNIQK